MRFWAISAVVFNFLMCHLGQRVASVHEGEPPPSILSRTMDALAGVVAETIDTVKSGCGHAIEPLMKMVAPMSDRTSMPMTRKRHSQIIPQKIIVPENWSAPIFEKSVGEASFIKKVVKTDALFNSLDDSDIEALIRAFEKVTFASGDAVITQGEPGDSFYIVDSGECDISVSGVTVMQAARGTKFGELALLHNAPRAASVTATSAVIAWKVDALTFKALLMDKAKQDTSDYLKFFEDVQLLRGLSKAEQLRLVDALQEEAYTAGSVIIREGTEGDLFYIIRDGEVKCTQFASGDQEVSKRLLRGDFFGELSLLSSQRRAATVTATQLTRTLTLERSAFNRLLGPLNHFLTNHADSYNNAGNNQL